MPDKTASERQGCCSSMPPCLKSNKAENVFPLDTCTLSMGIHHTYTCLATQIAGRHTEHLHKHSRSGLILLPALAEKDGDVLMEIYIIAI